VNVPLLKAGLAALHRRIVAEHALVMIPNLKKPPETVIALPVRRESAREILAQHLVAINSLGELLTRVPIRSPIPPTTGESAFAEAVVIDPTEQAVGIISDPRPRAAEGVEVRELTRIVGAQGSGDRVHVVIDRSLIPGSRARLQPVEDV